MKAIYVRSYNRVMATGPEDDMSWTGSLDKKLFRLLTTALKIVIVSKNCKDHLPKCMFDGVRLFKSVDRQTSLYSLKDYNTLYPDAALIGGPRFIRAALDEGVIDTVIETTIMDVLPSRPEYMAPDLKEKGFEKVAEIKFDDITIVKIWEKT